jgi:lysozyme
MKITKEALELIKEREGFVDTPYYCSANKLTIGYGHVILPDDNILGVHIIKDTSGKVKSAKGKITKGTGENLLKKDITKFEKDVEKLLTHKTTINQFSALVSLSFNIGINAFKNSTLLKYHNQGEFALASFEFMKWDNITVDGKLKEERGLHIRRGLEQKLYMKD